MKKILLLAFVFLSALCFGQGGASSSNYPISFVTQSGAPSGACPGPNVFSIDFNTPNLYYCPKVGGTWTVAGGAGSGTVSPGTRGEPYVNSTGSSVAATSPLFLDCSQFSGATVDVKVNACITAVIAAGGGTADARALFGNQAVAAQINVGDSLGDPVTLLLPNTGSWSATSAMNDGVSCVVKQYPNTSLIGDPAGGADFKFNFSAGGAPSGGLGYVYCSASTSLLYYYRASGFGVYVASSAAGPTANNLGFYQNGMADGSVYENITVQDFKDTTAALFDGPCCGSELRNSQIQSNYTGGIALSITESNSSNLIHAQGFTISSTSIVHPAAGSCALNISDTDTNHVLTVSLDDNYTETSNSDTTTALWCIAGARSVSIHNPTFHSEVASSTATAITLTNAYNTQLVVDGLAMGPGAGTFTYPATAVVNNNTSETESTDTSGNFSLYNSAPNFLHTLNAGVSKLGAITASAASNQLQLIDSSATADTLPTSIADSGSGGTNIAYEPGITTSGQGAGFRWCRSFNDTGGCYFSWYEGNNTTAVAWAFGPTGKLTTYHEVTTSGEGAIVNFGVDAATGQTATRTAQNIRSSTQSAGLYRIHWYIDQNAACTTATAGSVAVSFNWTDATAARASGTVGTLTFTTSASSTGAFAQGEFTVWAANATAITDTETYTACTLGTASYDFHADVERSQ